MKNIVIRELEGNGDFRSDECVAFLKEADVVVTNPPFSLFRQYVKQLMDYKKKFIIIGSQNACTDKEIFPLIKNNELWLGVNHIKEFIQPNKEIKKFGNICWYTNISNKRRNETLDLYKKYNEKEYPKYENYDAINVDKISDIPMDYKGIMGVPITILEHYNPTQFEIVGRSGNKIWALNECNFFKELNEDNIKLARQTGSCFGMYNAWYFKGNNLIEGYKRIFVKQI